jgi:MFS family permease
VSRYRALLAAPGATRLLLSVLFARLPLGMVSLAILLLVRASTGSIAIAALAIAAYALANAATAPAQGTLVDRHGQTRVLIPSAVLQSSLLIALTVAGRWHAPIAVLIACAALAGASAPPLSAASRALWAEVFGDPEMLESFYALDAVTQETIWIVGPLIVSVCAALTGPDLAVILCAAVSTVGTLLFCSTPASLAWRSGHAVRRRGGALASPSLRLLLCSIALTGCAWGCLTVGLPALGVQFGSTWDAGVLLTLTSLGSAAGGLGYSRRRWGAPLPRRYAALLAGIALSAVPLIRTEDLGMAVALAFVLGIAWAPAMSCQYALVQRAAPTGSVTEAFTWQTSAFTAGASGGAALAGVVAQSARAGGAFALLGGFALAAAALAASRQNQLVAGPS